MSCRSRKRAFATESDALAWLAITNEQADQRDRRRRRKPRKKAHRKLVAVYRCDDCGRWHMTGGWQPLRKAGRHSRKARAKNRAQTEARA